MFTVIIAEKSILDHFDEFNVFLNPLLDKNKVALCEWNREGKTIEEMLCDIYSIIEFHNEWRAVIVNSDGLYQINPFDYTEYKELRSSAGTADWESITERRQKRFDCYDKAINNPLTRLTIALSGTPVFNSAVHDESVYQKLISGELPLYEYMLFLQLDALNLSETAANLSKYQVQNLSRFVSEDQIGLLIDSVREHDTEKILSMIPAEKVIDFIELIGGNDPLYSDPEYVDCRIEDTYKFKLYEKLLPDFTFKDKLPTEVICVAPRTFDYDNFDRQSKWKKENDESRYSAFADWNLYPEKNKYIVFDIVPQDNKQYLFDQIRMFSFLMLLAQNSFPGGVVASKRLYRANVNFNNDAIERTCAAYLAKLKITLISLQEVESSLQTDIDDPLDNSTSQELFESDITIPINAAEYNRNDLYARFQNIGLAKDCPQDEEKYWDDQYHAIEKRFVRYLREPRRALKVAVKDEFHGNNRIEDERALQMNENQIEDVECRLFEEEENMVSTVTTQLFNTAKYKKELSDADKELRKGIAQRMTRKKTVAVAGAAILAYLIGFMPLIFRNINTGISRVFSLAMTGIVIAVFCCIGFVFLFILRHRLINRFQHFNYVMSGICGQIEDGLRAFSEYLSHACNVMRQFSVLNIKESSATRKQRILSYHRIVLRKKIKEANELFAKYIDCKAVNIKDVEPYDYDFTLLYDYKYGMPYVETKKKIVYMQPGNEITIPVDYVESITLTREELYD